MRFLSFAIAMLLVGPATALAGVPADPHVLEGAWHACLREAYAHQPEGQSRAGDARNTLDECKAHEDAYVAALMATQPDADLPLGGWTHTWAAYVAFVVDPVKAWIEALRR